MIMNIHSDLFQLFISTLKEKFDYCEFGCLLLIFPVVKAVT